MSLRQLSLAAVVAVVVGSALFPFEYMGPDQPEHLTLINRALDASYLRADWAINTHQVDSVRGWYVWLLAGLTRLFGSVPAHRGVWYAILAIDGAAIAAWAAAARSATPASITFAAALGTIYSFVFWFSTTSFLSSTPAPATLAQALCLASWACLLWERRGAALALGVVASLLHVQIGPSALIVGAVAATVRDRRVSPWTAAMLAAGLSFFGRGYLALGGSFAESQQAAVLLAEIRAPWHHLPQTWPLAQYVYLAQALIATGWLVAQRDEPLSRFVMGLIAGLGLWSIAGVIWLIAPDLLFLEKMSALRMWVMLAPIAGAALAMMLVNVCRRVGLRWSGMALAVMLAIVVLVGSKLRQLSIAIALLAAAPVLDAALPPGRRRVAANICALAIFAALSWGCLLAAREWRAPAATDLTQQASRRDRLALSECVRQRTPRDAVFLVPPQLPEWRLDLARAIFVDYKMFPVRNEDTIEWYRRMNTIVRQPAPARFVEDLPAAYRRLGASDVRRIAADEQLAFFVTDQDYAGLTVICAAGAWRAFDLQDSAAGAR